VDQDPHGALRPAEDTGDLRRRHLLDEPQDHGPPAICRQPPDGSPRGGGLVADGDAALDVERVGDERCGLDRRLWVTTAAATLVGDDVAGDPEKPDTERGRTISVAGTCSLLEPMEVGKGGEERPLGGVLGLVMVAELVIRVAVHLGEIPAIEGVEAGGITARLLDERAIPVEMGDAG